MKTPTEIAQKLEDMHKELELVDTNKETFPIWLGGASYIAALERVLDLEVKDGN